ncbi:MAG: DUF1989 domain-containing protein [Candidatus Binatia bacterium]
MTQYGEKREDIVVQPVSGKALELYRGEVLRIILVEGAQCVDFNAFNLHDYKEYLGVSNTRSQHGFRPKKGDIVWSVQSRNRPMFTILEMPETCVTDLLGGRCKAANHYPEGFTPGAYGTHTNCQDTFAACIGEYGLTPDDVHDSFNMWMNTEWDSRGQYWIVRNSGRKGDYVDLLAMFDTLAVPIVCGSGDTQLTSNYAFRPIQVQIFKASADTEAICRSYESKYGASQRRLEDFQVADIRTERELKRNPDYKPRFVNFPIITKRIPVELTEEELAALRELKKNGWGDTDGEALRAAFFTWYHRNRRPVPLRGRVRQG